MIGRGVSGAAVLLLLVSGALPVAAQQQAARACDRSYDFLHPAAFVRISELTRNGESIPIFQAKSAGQTVDRVDAEVDRRSRIRLAFDRQRILDLGTCFDGEITITASAPSGPVGVPGYTEYGERQSTATVRVRSATELVSVLREAEAQWDRIEGRIRAMIRDTPSSSEVTRTEALRNLEPRLDTLWDQWARADDQVSSAEGDETIEALRFRADSLSRVFNRLDQQRAAIERSILLGDEPTRSLVTRYMRAQQPTLSVALSQFRDSANAELVALVAEFAGRSPEVLRRTAELVADTWFGQLVTARTAADSVAAVQGIRDGLTVLGNLSGRFDANPDLFQSRLLSSLKDSDILLPPLDLHDGDRVLISIANGASRPEAHRALRVSIVVRHFGWTRRLSDSFLFVSRLGVDKAESEQAISQAQVESESTSTAVTAETPEPVRGIPTPGATLQWTFTKRSGFLHWLQPGLGLNVSFPVFRSKITSFDPPSSTGQPFTATVATEAQELGVSVGPVLSFWDGSLVLTAGNVITVEDDPWYWGIGFSFVSLGRRASSDDSGDSESQN